MGRETEMVWETEIEMVKEIRVDNKLQRFLNLRYWSSGGET